MKKPQYKPIEGYKGFDSALRCLNKQYEIGTVARCVGPLKLCENGLHFCTRPLDVLTYYSPVHRNRFAKVVSRGKTVCDGPDTCSNPCLTTKHATTVLDIQEEISLKDLVIAQNAQDRMDRPNCKVLLPDDIEAPRLAVKGMLSLDDNIDPVIAISVKPYSSSYCEATFGMTAVSVALAKGSLATSLYCRSIAVACGCYSAAWTQYDASVAIARGYDSVVMCSGTYSVGVAMDSKTAILLDGAHSVAFVPHSTGCEVKLSNHCQTAIVCPGNDVRVTGKHCVVVFAAEPFGTETLELVAGTVVIIPVGIQTPNHATKRMRVCRIMLEVGSEECKISGDRFQTTGAALLMRALVLAGEVDG